MTESEEILKNARALWKAGEITRDEYWAAVEAVCFAEAEWQVLGKYMEAK